VFLRLTVSKLSPSKPKLPNSHENNRDQQRCNHQNSSPIKDLKVLNLRMFARHKGTAIGRPVKAAIETISGEHRHCSVFSHLNRKRMHAIHLEQAAMALRLPFGGSDKIAGLTDPSLLISNTGCILGPWIKVRTN
jgi:hypothetical protein